MSRLWEALFGRDTRPPVSGRVDRSQIPTGTTILFGVPAQPIPPAVREGARAAVAALSFISEAHLPLVQAVGVMKEPRPVLIVVASETGYPEDATAGVVSALVKALPPGVVLDVWALRQDDPLLPLARGAGCELK